MHESRNLRERLAVYDAKAATIEQEIENEQARTEDIDKLKEYMQTDEYAEQVAKDKLGLVYEDEIIFKPEEN